MDYSLEHHKSYIGRPALDLPTPSLILSKHILEENIKKLHEDVSRLGTDFRPHTKTLKCLEATRMMLGGRFRKIVCSTVPEIVGSLPLIKEGVLDECIFGFPIFKTVLPRLEELTQHIKIDLLVDHEQQVTLLETSSKSWNVLIKIDVGAERAGLPANNPKLKDLVKRIEASESINLKGFYCHANHSYNCRTENDTKEMLHHEISGVLEAVTLLPSSRQLLVSIGATPTAHVIETLRAAIPANVSLELHAGNFPTNDLQQVSTGVVTLPQQAVRVLADIVSVYPKRNEALINAGVLVLAREASAFPGFGKVVHDNLNWDVVRVSQEHGIIGCRHSMESVENAFKVDQKVFIWCQHSCITAAAMYAFYVVDEQDIVKETWVPWKGW